MNVAGKRMSFHPWLSAHLTILYWAVTGEGAGLQFSAIASECLLHFNTCIVDPASICSAIAKLDNGAFHFIAQIRRQM